jgi:RNA polymerase sigma factor (sigma-70 family)
VTRSPEPGSGKSQLLSADQAEAVEKLYRAAVPRLFRRARFLSQGDCGQAEDLVQLVFQAAIMCWETIGHKDSGEQMAWLYTVLHYKAVDAWRVNRKEYFLTDVVSGEPQSLQDAGYQALCSIALDKALKVIRGMPPVRYRVVCLRLLAGLSTREVAGVLGIAQSTVRGHMQGALDDLRREVGPMLPYADDDPRAGQRPQEGRR